MKIQVTVFWVVTPWNFVVEYRCSRGPCCPQLHTEDEGSMDLWNISITPQHFTVLQPRRPQPETSTPRKPQKSHILHSTGQFRGPCSETMWLVYITDIAYTITLHNVNSHLQHFTLHNLKSYCDNAVKCQTQIWDLKHFGIFSVNEMFFDVFERYAFPNTELRVCIETSQLH